MYFEQITTPGLSCFSYIIGCPQAGVAAVVDPKRDMDDYLRLAHENGLRITHIFDTHVHADHISGARELSRAVGADIYIHESAPVGYNAKKTRHNDEFDFGAAHVRVLHTPGHTPDSVSLLVSDTVRSPEPQMILTGDLLFVGDIGRPDLPGEEILPEQVRNLFDSLNRTLGELPDSLEVYPGHGQGSMCGGSMSARPHSTLGYERIANRRLRLKNFDEFSKSVLSQLLMRPQSFAHIIAANLSGAHLSLPCDTGKKAFTVDELEAIAKQGATLLDLRDSLSFAAAHIKGSMHVDAGQSIAPNWIGTTVPPKSRLVLIMERDADFAEHHTMLRRIGYDDVAGYLDGGIAAWINNGKPMESIEVTSAHALKKRLAGEDPPLVVDVRASSEYAEFHIPGSMNLPLEKLLADDSCLAESPEQVLVCLTGYRSATAAALLQTRGCKGAGFMAGGIRAFRNG